MSRVFIGVGHGGGNGFEVYRQTSRYVTQSLELAVTIKAEVKKIGQNSRGVKIKLSGTVDYFGWFRQLNCPAVLCEGAFLDNATDVQIIRHHRGAAGIWRGLRKVCAGMPRH